MADIETNIRTLLPPARLRRSDRSMRLPHSTGSGLNLEAELPCRRPSLVGDGAGRDNAPGATENMGQGRPPQTAWRHHRGGGCCVGHPCSIGRTRYRSRTCTIICPTPCPTRCISAADRYSACYTSRDTRYRAGASPDSRNFFTGLPAWPPQRPARSARSGRPCQVWSACAPRLGEKL